MFYHPQTVYTRRSAAISFRSCSGAVDRRQSCRQIPVLTNSFGLSCSDHCLQSVCLKPCLNSQLQLFLVILLIWLLIAVSPCGSNSQFCFTFKRNRTVSTLADLHLLQVHVLTQEYMIPCDGNTRTHTVSGSVLVISFTPAMHCNTMLPGLIENWASSKTL